MFSFKQKEPCGVCAEKDRTITVLAEQIEYLRTLLGTPKPAHLGRDARDEPRLVPTALPQYVSEDEEDIRALVAGGHLPLEVAHEALTQLGADTTTLEFDRFNNPA